MVVAHVPQPEQLWEDFYTFWTGSLNCSENYAVTEMASAVPCFSLVCLNGADHFVFFDQYCTISVKCSRSHGSAVTQLGRRRGFFSLLDGKVCLWSAFTKLLKPTFVLSLCSANKNWWLWLLATGGRGTPAHL